MTENQLIARWAAAIVLFIVAVIVSMMAGCPQYNVYRARLNGQATEAESQGARQALVSQAQAEKDAAVLRADAIKVLGQAAKDFPEYRQQEFLGSFAEALREGKIAHTIYIPTEANIPITEAGKR